MLSRTPEDNDNSSLRAQQSSASPSPRSRRSPQVHQRRYKVHVGIAIEPTMRSTSENEPINGVSELHISRKETHQKPQVPDVNGPANVLTESNQKVNSTPKNKSIVSTTKVSSHSNKNVSSACMSSPHISTNTPIKVLTEFDENSSSTPENTTMKPTKVMRPSENSPTTVLGETNDVLESQLGASSSESCAQLLQDSEPNNITSIATNQGTASSTPNATADRPRIGVDISNSGSDLLYVSGIPRQMTYDHIIEVVQIFGEVSQFNWSASDPSTCEVIYEDPHAAREAAHYLDNAIVGGASGTALRATARSRQADTELLITNVATRVTEDELEDTFAAITGTRCSAVLKCDPHTRASLGYGYLSFDTPAAARRALGVSNTIKIAGSYVRLGQVDRGATMIITEFGANADIAELSALSEQFGAVMHNETMVLRRSYAFVRYKERMYAEQAKRSLDKTSLHRRLNVRYAEAEAVKDTVSVQFHCVVPPQGISDALLISFSQYGPCKIDIPHLSGGAWRRVAFVSYVGEALAASRSANDALHNIRSVAGVPVCCQWARHILPRLPSHDLFNGEPSVSVAETIVNSRLRYKSHAPPPSPYMSPPPMHPAPFLPTYMVLPYPDIPYGWQTYSPPPSPAHVRAATNAADRGDNSAPVELPASEEQVHVGAVEEDAK